MFEGMTEEPQVLIVDDVSDTRAFVRDMLREMGITRVMEAQDGAEALTKLNKYGAQLIICDHMMESMTGLELLEQLKRYCRLSAIPVLMVSGCGDVPVVDAALELGAADYLVKPISFNLFRRKIHNLIGRRVSCSSSAEACSQPVS
jgi:two-component system chemotaxis response regulator CheY